MGERLDVSWVHRQGWRITRPGPHVDDAPEATRLDGALVHRERGLAEQVLAGHLAPEVPGLLVVGAPQHVTLDDLMAAWLLVTGPRDGGDPALVALAAMAASARRGIRPGQVPVHRTLYAVFDEVQRERRDPEALEGLLDRGFALLEHALARIQSGADPIDDDLFTGAHPFLSELGRLASDHSLYEEDRDHRGERHMGRVQDCDVDVLVLRRPRSRRFADFARSDPSAPLGRGFSLLAAQWTDGTWVFTADPARRLRIEGLADALERAEQEAWPSGAERPSDDPWYDGRNHDHTLVAPPRAGTRLSDDAILEVVRGAWHLEPHPEAPRTHPRRWKGWAFGATAAAVLLGAVGLAWLAFQDPGAQDPPRMPTDRGSFTRPDLPSLAPASVLDLPDEQLHRRRLAILVGFSGYASLEDLPNGSRDASDVAAALQEHWGFETLVIDDEWEGQKTSAAILGEINRQLRQLAPEDLMLVYWSGHGLLAPGNQASAHLALPHTTEDNPFTGISMRTLWEENLRSWGDSGPRHRWLMVDTCYSGVLARRLDTLSLREAATAQDHAYYRTVSRGKAAVLFTSGTELQTVEDGSGRNSPFAKALIRALGDPGIRETVGNRQYLTSTRLAEAIDRAAQAHLERGMGAQMVQYETEGSGKLVLDRPLTRE